MSNIPVTGAPLRTGTHRLFFNISSYFHHHTTTSHWQRVCLCPDEYFSDDEVLHFQIWAICSKIIKLCSCHDISRVRSVRMFWFSSRSDMSCCVWLFLRVTLQQGVCVDSQSLSVSSDWSRLGTGFKIFILWCLFDFPLVFHCLCKVFYCTCDKGLSWIKQLLL